MKSGWRGEEHLHRLNTKDRLVSEEQQAFDCGLQEFPHRRPLSGHYCRQQPEGQTASCDPVVGGPQPAAVTSDTQLSEENTHHTTSHTIQWRDVPVGKATNTLCAKTKKASIHVF